MEGKLTVEDLVTKLRSPGAREKITEVAQIEYENRTNLTGKKIWLGYSEGFYEGVLYGVSLMKDQLDLAMSVSKERNEKMNDRVSNLTTMVGILKANLEAEEKRGEFR